MMIAANIRNLSLLELFYTCTANLAKVMVSRGVTLPEKQKHYVEKDDYNAFILSLIHISSDAEILRKNFLRSPLTPIPPMLT